MEEITPLLEKLAEQLNTTVEFLWEVLVNQAQVYVWIYLSQFLILGIFSFGLFWCIRYIKKNWEDIDDMDDAWVGLLLVAILVLFVGTIISTIIQIGGYSEFLTALLNPEYWALQQILEFVK